MTQIEFARKGVITPEMKQVAHLEQVSDDFICENIACGKVVIPANTNHPVSGVCGIGKGLKIKVNANIGTSSDVGTLAGELIKLNVSIKHGADTVMDLSTGGDINKIRRSVLQESTIPVGTVPIYQAMIEAGQKYGPIVQATADDIFKAIEEQAADGVDFITVHCGVTQAAIKSLKNQRRVTDVVSHGGAFLLGWMLYHDKENPLLKIMSVYSISHANMTSHSALETVCDRAAFPMQRTAPRYKSLLLWVNWLSVLGTQEFR